MSCRIGSDGLMLADRVKIALRIRVKIATRYSQWSLSTSTDSNSRPSRGVDSYFFPRRNERRVGWGKSGSHDGVRRGTRTPRAFCSTYQREEVLFFFSPTPSFFFFSILQFPPDALSVILRFQEVDHLRILVDAAQDFVWFAFDTSGSIFFLLIRMKSGVSIAPEHKGALIWRTLRPFGLEKWWEYLSFLFRYRSEERFPNVLQPRNGLMSEFWSPVATRGERLG